MKKPRTVLVTGASAGVGRATAIAFARQGATVGLLARGIDGLEGARREVQAAGGRGIILPVDVANAEAVEGAAEALTREIGEIDVWVNNAMVSVFSPVVEMTAEEFRRVTEVTYLGVVYGTLAALKRMVPRDAGCIVQVGSALAYRGIPLQSAYCAAKHAIHGFCESLRTELAHQGSRVRLTMVQLPAVNTPQFDWTRSRLPHRAQPVPPIFQPEVAAKAIVWAATTRKPEVWVGWPTVKTIVGNDVAPGVEDWILSRDGYDLQQTAEPARPDRPDNLFEPVAGDHGVHGRFDSCARPRSLLLDSTIAAHRSRVPLAAAAALGAVWMATRSWRHRAS